MYIFMNIIFIIYIYIYFYILCKYLRTPSHKQQVTQYLSLGKFNRTEFRVFLLLYQLP